jgi:hypothetical protein
MHRSGGRLLGGPLCVGGLTTALPASPVKGPLPYTAASDRCLHGGLKRPTALPHDKGRFARPAKPCLTNPAPPCCR